jgi:hypothetical protein
MVAFLKMNNYRWDLSGMVKPRRRFREKNIKGLNEEKARVWGDDLEDLSSWISGLEDDGKGVPILLKQYIRLGGKLLSFNVDQAFGHALDGLILVDLTQTEDRALRKYMGKRGFERFKDFHSGRLSTSGASGLTRTSVVK